MVKKVRKLSVRKLIMKEMPNSKLEQQQNEMYDAFLKQRNVYEFIHTESEKRLDVVVVSVSCAAIGWYVAFHKFIDFGNSSWALWLKLTVLCGFGGALVFNLLSLYFARWNADKKLDEADKDYKQRKALLLNGYEVPDSADKKFWTHWAVVGCNGISLGGTILGIVGVLLCVAVANTDTPTKLDEVIPKTKEKVMSENNKQGVKGVPVFDGLTAVKKAPELRTFHNGLTPVAKNPPKKSK